MSRSRIGAGLLALLMALSAAIGLAQNPPETESGLNALRESVEALQRRVEKLEANQQNDLKQAVQQLTEQLDALEKLQTGGTTKPKETHHAAEEPASGTIERFDGHASQLRGIAISPDGHWGASTDGDGVLRIWDLRLHRDDEVFSSKFERSAGPARFSPDGKFLFVTAMNKSTMFEVGSWKTRWTAATSFMVPRDVAFSPDSKIIALPGRDEIELRDVETGEVMKTVTFDPDGVVSIEFGPDGDELFATGFYYNNGTTPITYYGRLWNWKTGQETLRMNYPIRSSAWNVERGRLYVVGQAHQVEEWDTKTGKRIRIWDDTSNHGWTLALSSDGGLLALGVSDAIELWDTRTAKRLNHVELPDVNPQHLALRDDGRYALVATISENTVWGIGFDAPNPTPPREQVRQSQPNPTAAPAGDGPEPIGKLANQNAAITAFALSSDGRHLYTAAQDLTFRKWDLESGKELDKLQWAKEHGTILEIDASRDGERLLTSGRESTLSRGVRVWNTKNWTMLRELGTNTTGTPDDRSTFEKLVRERVTAIALEPEGELAAISYRDSKIRLWNVETGEITRTLTGPARGMYDLAFSRDGKTLAAVGPDGVWVWEVESGETTGRLPQQGQTGFQGASIEFSPNAGNLLVPSQSGLLEVRLGRERLASRILVTPPGDKSHQFNPPTNVAKYSPNGELILARDFWRVYVFDAETGAELVSFAHHRRIGKNLAFTPDSTRFLTLGPNNAVAVWAVPERKANASAQAASPPSPIPPTTRPMPRPTGSSAQIAQPARPSTTSPAAQPDPETSKIELPRGGIVPFEISEFARHEHPIQKLILSPDDRWIATIAGQDAAIAIWDAETRQRIATVDAAPLQGMLDIAFTPNSDALAIAGTQGVKLVSTLDWTRNWTSRLPAPLPGTIVRLDISEDGEFLAVAGDSALKIWEIDRHKIVEEAEHNFRNVTALQFGIVMEPGTSPETVLIVGQYSRPGMPGGSQQLRILNWKTDRPQFSSSAQHADVAWDAERERLYTLRQGGGIAEWNLRRSSQMREWPGTANVNRIALSPDGRFLAASTHHGTVELWLTESALKVESMAVPMERADHLAINSDATRFIVTGRNGQTLHGGTFRMASRADSIDLDAIGGEDWLHEIITPQPAVKILSGPSRDRIKQQRESKTPPPVFNILPTRRVRGPSLPVRSLALSPDGKTAYLSTVRSGLDHWDLRTGESLLGPRDKPPIHRIQDIQCLPDGKTLVYLNTTGGGLKHHLVVWDAESWKPVREIGGFKNHIYRAVVSPDGKLAAVSGRQQPIMIVDLSTGETIRTMPVNRPVMSLAFSPENRYLAGMDGDAIRVWNVESGEQLIEEERTLGYSPTSRSLSFLPDKPTRLLISGEALAMRPIENWSDQEIVQTSYGPGMFQAGICSPDGGRILAIHGDRAYVWDVKTGKELVSVPCGEATAEVACFTPDGTHFLTVGEDNTLVIWPIPDPALATESADATAAVIAPRPPAEISLRTSVPIDSSHLAPQDESSAESFR